MNSNKKAKVEGSEKMGGDLQGAAHLFFADYHGLKFKEMDELRGKLGAAGCRFSVVKNTLLRFALGHAGFDGASDEIFRGQTALVVARDEDPVAAAKVLESFGKEYPAFKLKAGYVWRSWFAPAEVKKLSGLPTRMELLGKVASGLYGVAAGMAGVAQAPLRDLILALRAVSGKKESAAPAQA